MVLRWWANREGKVIIGILPDSEDRKHQVRREAWAGVLALEAAALELDLSEAIVVLRNDAVGARTALRKGSFSSTFLKQCAMRAFSGGSAARPTTSMHPGASSSTRALMITLRPGPWRWPARSAATLSGPTPGSSPQPAAGL